MGHKAVFVAADRGELAQVKASPDPFGSRAQRRAWAKLNKTKMPAAPEVEAPLPACARCGDPESAQLEVCRDVAEGGGIKVFSDARGELIAKYCEFRGSECPRKPICDGCWNNLYGDTPVESWWLVETAPERELCWKPIGEFENCDRWEGHTRRCLATCGDCREGRCHIPVDPPKPGVGDPSCGCTRHADSLLAERWDQAEA